MLYSHKAVLLNDLQHCPQWSDASRGIKTERLHHITQLYLHKWKKVEQIQSGIKSVSVCTASLCCYIIQIRIKFQFIEHVRIQMYHNTLQKTDDANGPVNNDGS